MLKGRWHTTLLFSLDAEDHAGTQELRNTIRQRLSLLRQKGRGEGAANAVGMG